MLRRFVDLALGYSDLKPINQGFNKLQYIVSLPNLLFLSLLKYMFPAF